MAAAEPPKARGAVRIARQCGERAADALTDRRVVGHTSR